MQYPDMKFFGFAKISERLPSLSQSRGIITEYKRREVKIVIFDYANGQGKKCEEFVIYFGRKVTIGYPLGTLDAWLRKNTVFAGSVLVEKGSQLLIK